MPVIGLAQTEPLPPKKAKKIIVSNKDSISTAVKKIAIAFFERGYTIESKDENLGYIATNEKSHEKFSTSMKVRAIVKDTVIVLSGVFSLNIEFNLGGVTSTKSFDDVYNGGSKRSPLRSSWDELTAIARSIGVITRYE